MIPINQEKHLTQNELANSLEAVMMFGVIHIKISNM